MTLDEVIARLEAGEAFREIEQDIYHVLGLCQKQADGTCVDYTAPRYCLSLDAVASMTPPDLPWLKVEHFSDGWYAEIGRRSYDPPSSKHICRQAETEVIARLIAVLRALKARQP